MRLVRPTVALVPVLAAAAALAQTPAGPGRVGGLDPRLDALIPKDARVELLASGIKWAEGPVWDAANERLLFSDVPNNVVYQWTEKAGKGGLPEAERVHGAGGRRWTRAGIERPRLRREGPPDADPVRGPADLEARGREVRSPVVERFEGKRFDGPNDLRVGQTGRGALLHRPALRGRRRRSTTPAARSPGAACTASGRTGR